MAVADTHGLGRIARSQRELGWRLADKVHDHFAVEPHPELTLIDRGAGRRKRGPGARLKHFHADFFEDGETGVMDRLDLIGAQYFDGAVGQCELLPRPLLHGAGYSLRAGAASRG